MSPESFDVLLRHVEPHISKENTRFCESVPAITRLAVTLRYLASSESQQLLSWSFRVGRTTVSKIGRETCEAIWKVASTIYLRSPSKKGVFYILKNKAASIQICEMSLILGFGVLCDMLSRKQMIRRYAKRLATVGL